MNWVLKPAPKPTGKCARNIPAGHIARNLRSGQLCLRLTGIMAFLETYNYQNVSDCMDSYEDLGPIQVSEE